MGRRSFRGSGQPAFCGDPVAYMDVHIPRAITEGLRLRGVDVLTAQKDGSGEVSDSDLLTRASSLGRVLFSMDADLLCEASRRQAEGGPGCGSPLDGGHGRKEF